LTPLNKIPGSATALDSLVTIHQLFKKKMQ